MPEYTHKELLTSYHSWLGYDPSWAKERVGAKRLLVAGYSLDNIERCYKHFKSTQFWRDKHLSLTYIASNIGAWEKEYVAEEKDLDKWYRENN